MPWCQEGGDGLDVDQHDSSGDQMPSNENGTQRHTRPRSTSQVATTATITNATTVTDAGEIQQARGPARLPVAFASQAAPCAGRALWHVMYQCGACNGTHFGRSHEELVTSKRLARCGRVVYLVIARTYRGPDEGAAA
jgi:hypothetical protein